MDAKFFDSLYEGDSPNGIKLCMGVTGGDFWARNEGCQNLYRGGNIEAVDFDTVVVVGDADDGLIEPANANHDAGVIYFYVVRRANICGYEEQSLRASAKVGFDSQGDLIGHSCNMVLSVKGQQTAGPKVKLMWYYCPVEQGQRCKCFKVYWDNGTGVIDYDNELGEAAYAGKRFNSFQSGALTAGRYLFCVQAISSDGSKSSISGLVEIQISGLIAEGVDILQSQLI